MTPSFAELPDMGYLVAGCVVIALVVLVGISVILRFGKDLRSNLAEELRRELSAKAEPSNVNVQSPLIVSEHKELITRREHEELARKMDAELGRERSSRKTLYEKTEAIGSRVARVEEKTDAQTRQLNSLDTKMDQVLMRLPRPS